MAGKREGAGVLSRTVQRRLAEIEGCERRGESLKAYAERKGQSVGVFYEAKRQARQAGVLPPPRGASAKAPRRATRAVAAPRFVEAVATARSVEGPRLPDTVAWRLRLPSGALLESTTPLDTASLDRLVAGLGGGS